MLLPTIQPRLRVIATRFVAVILDLATCVLGVNLIPSTAIYRAPVGLQLNKIHKGLYSLNSHTLS